MSRLAIDWLESDLIDWLESNFSDFNAASLSALSTRSSLSASRAELASSLAVGLLATKLLLQRR
jgi:hypothetical protein